MKTSMILAEDKKCNTWKSFIILSFYRITHSLYVNNNPFTILALTFFLFLQKLVFILLCVNSQISYKSIIGKRVRLLHAGDGVVISKYARIGDDVTIYHQVTIGVNESLDESEKTVIIGDGCYLSAGCKVISCTIGSGSKIGPNSVVVNDIDENSLVYSAPIVKSRYYDKNDITL